MFICYMWRIKFLFLFLIRAIIAFNNSFNTALQGCDSISNSLGLLSEDFCLFFMAEHFRLIYDITVLIT